jgi:hypothetical protein
MRASFPNPAFQVLCEKISVSRLLPGASPPVRDRRPVRVARKDRTLGDESRVPLARIIREDIASAQSLVRSGL